MVELEMHPAGYGEHARTPPYAPEAEVAVLGGMVNNAGGVTKALDSVDDTMFYREAHRRIFRAMSRLFQRGQVVDPVTLAEELSKTDELESVGGLAYLGELLDAVPTAANIEYHCRIVRERATLRKLIEASSSTIRDCYEPGERTVEEVVEAAEQRVLECAGSAKSGATPHHELLYGVIQDVESGAMVGMPTGFPDIDENTGGLQKGDLVIVAARPSMGKTAFVTSIALHTAIAHRLPVAIFSLEMSAKQVVARALCSEAMVDLGRFFRNRMYDDEYGRIATAAGTLKAAAPLLIDDRGSYRIGELRAAARRLKVEHPELALIIVDYIQLMAGGGDAENRQQEVTEISRGLKTLAKDLDLPVIALSQLSRAPEQRANHKPQLSDLRESGSIEQDADVVGFLYRPEYYMTRDEAQEKGAVGKAEFIIGKQRNGPTGEVPLYFRSYCARYESAPVEVRP